MKRIFIGTGYTIDCPPFPHRETTYFRFVLVHNKLLLKSVYFKRKEFAPRVGGVDLFPSAESSFLLEKSRFRREAKHFNRVAFL